jgi:putative DNA primase/helicase
MSTANDHAPLTPLAAALAYHAAGLCVLPILRDGSKQPSCRWKQYQSRRPTEAELRSWFAVAAPPGVAILGGAVSGGLECLDFDIEAETIFPDWCELVETEAPGLLAGLSVARTPKPGFHVRYCCPEITIPGNTKLAMDPDLPGDKQTLIETRGTAGYGLAPGCPAECHETHRLYEHFQGPDVANIKTITAADREILIRCACSFDRAIQDEQAEPKHTAGSESSSKPKTGTRPGDDYSVRGPDWQSILGPHGWKAVHHRGDVTYWRRPHKVGKGWSGTTGHCKRKNDKAPLFAVFSSNATPFPGPGNGKICSAHSKFAVFALLNHRGDFSAAAREIALLGYGDQQRRYGRRGYRSRLYNETPTRQRGHSIIHFSVEVEV